MFDWVERIPSPGHTIWTHVKEVVERAVAARKLNPGDKLPSEDDLKDAFGCSRSAIRQAKKALLYEGLIVVRRPRTYIADDALDKVRRLTSLHDPIETPLRPYSVRRELRAAFRSKDGRTLVEMPDGAYAIGWVPTDEEARRFGFATGTPVVEIIYVDERSEVYDASRIYIARQGPPPSEC